MRTVYDFSVKDRKGKMVSLKEYANEVLLIVNTATRCGFTPQYEELEQLYEKYHQQGFEVLDFPCNQFGQQAPGTDESIHNFCKLTYGTEFSRFKKVKVNGDDAEPLFKFLKEQRGFAGWDESHPHLPGSPRGPFSSRPRLPVEARHQVELHQVPHQQEGSGCCPLRAHCPV